MEEALNLYIDGELDFDRQAALFAHLSTCACCRRTLESVLTFRRLSREEPLVVPPAVDDAFFKRLASHRESHENVDRAAERRPLWQSRAPISVRTGVAAAVIVFLLGLLVPTNIDSTVARFQPAVVGMQEFVELRPVAADRPPSETLYVFYPGLTVEAAKID